MNYLKNIVKPGSHVMTSLLMSVALFLVAINSAVAQATILANQQSDGVYDASTMAQMVLPYAQLSSLVYGNLILGDTGTMVSGNDEVNSWKILEDIVDPFSGFHATLFSIDGKTVFSFEGTSFSAANVAKSLFLPDIMNSKNLAADLATNVAAGVAATLPVALYNLASMPDQYVEAYLWTRKFLAAYPELEVTGHSLGGGLAQYVGAELQVPAVTFNAAGVNGKYINQQLGDNLVNITLGSDIVSQSLPGNQIGTQYNYDSPLGNVAAHSIDTLVKVIQNSSKIAPEAMTVDWTMVQNLSSNALAVVQGFTSQIGRASSSLAETTLSSTILSQAVQAGSANGLYVPSSSLAESQWVIAAGGAGNVGQWNGVPEINNAGVWTATITKEFVVRGSSGASVPVSFSSVATFITTEYPVWVGSQYNDTGNMTVSTSGGSVKSFNMANASVNGSALTAINGLQGPLGAVQGGLGGTTGPVSGGAAFSVQPGSKIMVSITVKNVGDTEMPSAILLNKLMVK